MSSVLTVLILFCTLMILGAGATAWLLKKHGSDIEVLALAPIMGLASVLLLGTWLIQLGLPVSIWAWPLTLLLGTASCLVAAKTGKSITAKPGVEYRLYFWILMGCGLLLLAPTLIGGAEMFTLRGNLIDDVNYMIGARALDRHSVDFLRNTASDTLVNLDPSLLLVKRSLWWERVPIVSLLAWAANLTGFPLLQMEWGFTLTFFLLAIGPCILFCRELKLGKSAIAAVGLAITCGFWAQLVLDLRAMGQIVNLPLMLGLAWASLSLARTPSIQSSALWVLLLTSACLSYPEMVPSLTLSLGLFFCLPVLKQAPQRKHLLGATLVALILLCSQPTFFWRFLVRQLHAATVRGTEMAWEHDWFRFLYDPSPIQGFWGFSWGPDTGKAIHWLLLAAGLLCSAILATLLVRGLKDLMHDKATRPRANALIASFAFTFLSQWVVMGALGNPWAGAKALSYGYAFFTLLIACALSAPETGNRPQPQKPYALFRKISIAGCLLFFGMQTVFACYRLACARDGSTFFVRGEPLHRSGTALGYDRELTQLASVFENYRGSHVWTLQPDVWDMEQFNLVFGASMHFAPLLGTDHYAPERLISQTLAAKLARPELLLVNRSFFGELAPPGLEPIAQSKTNRLYRFTASYWESPQLLGIHKVGAGNLEHTNTAIASKEGMTFDFATSDAVNLWLHCPRAGALSISQDQTKRLIPLRAGLNEVRLGKPKSPTHYQVEITLN